MRYERIPGTVVVAFIGHARHGKDQAAKYVIESLPGGQAQRFAVSDAISAFCRVEHRMRERNPALLQRIGYELRNARPNVWLDALYWTIYEQRPRVALVTGLRFDDEIAMVRDAGGVIVRITRVLSDGTPFVSGDRDPNHPVERDIDALECDHEIVNVTGQLPAFRVAAVETFQAILRRLEAEAQQSQDDDESR